MKRPLLLMITAAGLAAITLAGCGGDSSGSSGGSSGQSATQILATASAKTKQQTSYHVALTAKADVSAQKGALGGQAGALLSQPLDISGEGTVQKPGDISFDLSTKIATSPIQINLTKVGDGLYVSVLGQSFQIPLPKGSVKSVDPTGLPSSIAGWITNPQIVGDEDLAGTPTVHIRGDVDAAALTKDLESLASTVGSSGTVTKATATQAQAALQKGVVDVWVGTEDDLIHGADADVALKGKVDAIQGVDGLALTVSTRLSDFGTTVKITAPAGAKTLDLANVGSLLGG